MGRALIAARPIRARLAIAPLMALALLLPAAGTAAGRGIASAGSPGSVVAPIGYDVSYPQCGGSLPTNVAFAVVGVNGGRVYSPNPCLGAGEHPSQLAWAGRGAELYANTGNPGPALSDYWPVGQVEPRVCSADDLDSVDCAYDYGWNAAADSYATAVAAYESLGWTDAEADAEAGADEARTPAAATWWLDVEVANSWRRDHERRDHERNVAALRGAVDYLESVGVAEVGFYSAPRMWETITGGTDAFADYPSWVAGASTLEEARAACDGPGITGGPVVMAQYFAHGFDADYRCGTGSRS